MGVREGMRSSQGDWRVLLVMNLLLSAAFGYLLVVGLSLIGALTFRWSLVAGATLILVILTFLITR